MFCIVGLIVISIIGTTVRAFSISGSIETLPPCHILALIYPDLDIRATLANRDFFLYSGVYMDTTSETINSNSLLTGNNTTPLNEKAKSPLTGDTTTHPYELTNDEIRRILVEYSYICHYFLPINGLFGLIGNTLTSVALLGDQKRPLNGFSVYLVALAGTDSISLLNSLYYWTANCLFQRSMTPTECKLMVWMLYSSQAIGCWLIAAIGVNRLTAVVKPLYRVAACTPRRAILVFTALYILASLYYLPYLAWVGTRNGMCHYTLPSRSWKIIYPVLNMAIVAAPVTIMVYCNGQVAAAVIRRGRRLEFARKNALPHISLARYSSTVSPGPLVPSDSRSSSSSVLSIATIGHGLLTHRHVPLAPSPRDMSKDRHTLGILFLVTFVFLLLNLPYHVKCVLDHMSGNQRRDNFRRDVVIMYVFLCALYMNNSINFLLYCMSASKFRHQVARLLRCGPKCVQPE